MVSQLALTLLFGKPLIMYGGLSTLTLLLVTAIIGYGTIKGWFRVSIKWHTTFAILTIVSALFHGLFGLSIMFGF